jgi:hypothetical protein
MHDESSELAAPRPPLGQLERALIDEFVRARGHDPAAVAGLPEHERQELLKEASLFASARLAEVEARSHFVDEIHGGTSELAIRGLE